MQSHSYLYSTKLKNLPLRDVDARLEHYHSILDQELARKKIKMKFHIWVSDEWFCPDGVPGLAIPFYLFNPELMQIQKKELGFVDGKNEKEILKLLRHELGHAVDNAFALRKLRDKSGTFGSSRQDYPDYYQPKKYSRNFIHYLGDHYAQSHPDEDFAETFAYWLDPWLSQWPRFAGSQLRAKITDFEELMSHVQSSQQVLKNKWEIDSVFRNNMTLKEFYRRRKYEFAEKHWRIRAQGPVKMQKSTKLSPRETLLIERNVRYLIDTDQLKYYL